MFLLLYSAVKSKHVEQYGKSSESLFPLRIVFYEILGKNYFFFFFIRPWKVNILCMKSPLIHQNVCIKKYERPAQNFGC